jgi:phytoene synthase
MASARTQIPSPHPVPQAHPQSQPLGADPADLRAIEQIVRRAGTRFYQGMRVLPPDRRYAMYAIYAFCRLVDDIADDDDAGAADRRARLDEWRRRIAALYRARDLGGRGLGQDEDAVTRVLRAAIAEYQLRREDFLAVIDGMALDAEAIVAPAMPDLDLYCDKVAAAVGRLSVRAFGDASAAADTVAYHLGRALQLTNILRDIAEDAARGRLYLPRELLLKHAVPLTTAAALGAPGLPAVCRELAGIAHQHFAAATGAMRRCDRRAMRPARLMAATYDAILSRLERAGWTDLTRRVSLPAWQKLWLVTRHAY